jgi:hypothetical protein
MSEYDVEVARVRMVLVNSIGVVHDLATSNHCSEMINLRREFSRGTERYVSVKGVQVRAYNLPGCSNCFGSRTAFDEYIKTT